MTRGLELIAFIWLAATLSQPGYATILTEAEFLAVLTDGHPAVVALGGEVAVAERASASSYVDNPGLDFFLESPRGVPGQATWALTWKPPLDGRRGLQKKTGAAQLAAAESGLAWSKLQLRTTMRALYADWWRLTEMEALLAAHVASVSRLAVRSERRAERGEESGLDAGRLRFAAAEMSAALASMRADLARTTAEVRMYASDVPVGTRPERPDLPAPPSGTSVDQHPAVEGRRHALQGAQHDKKQSGRFIEFPELLAGWTRISGDNASSDGPVVGVRWDFPLFDRNQGERAMTARNLAVAEAQLSLTAAEIEAHLSASRDAYDNLRQASLDLQEDTADAAMLITAATSAFDNNETSVTDLLEALRSILSGRQAAVDLYHEALAAHRDLEMSVGHALMTGGGE